MSKSSYLISLLFLFIITVTSFAADSYGFRVYLNNKGNEAIQLSPQALERRKRLSIPLDDMDRPIASQCLDSLEKKGFQIIVSSRWLSTVVVATNDSANIERLQHLSIVDSIKWVWKGEIDQSSTIEKSWDSDQHLKPSDNPLRSPYGYAEEQIKMLKGDRLHKAGFKGKGVVIAVIDDGFRNADRITAFDSLQLMGTRNFVFPQRSVFEGDDHGTKVLSCLAAYEPGVMIGTAPEASYWLIKSEDNRSEFPIEEDYWTAAAEFADSVGVDMITTSLGYSFFDENTMNYSHNALDGQTAHISKAAEIAAEKGILIFCSAGNEGTSRWGRITFPADAKDILTIGAITTKKEKSVFSSPGYSTDGRIKPDLVALGSGCCVIEPTGNLRYANGTSFSTPILAGLGACLWQALPWLSPNELIELLRQSGSQYKHPDEQLGYGLPNIYKIYKKERKNGK